MLLRRRPHTLDKIGREQRARGLTSNHSGWKHTSTLHYTHTHTHTHTQAHRILQRTPNHLASGRLCPVCRHITDPATRQPTHAAHPLISVIICSLSVELERVCQCGIAQSLPSLRPNSMVFVQTRGRVCVCVLLGSAPWKSRRRPLRWLRSRRSQRLLPSRPVSRQILRVPWPHGPST